jgi:hypothetical protein
MIYDMLVDLLVPPLPGEGEVVQAGDAEHGVVDAVAFEAAVAEDLPGLHTGEDVLDAGADLLVGLVVFLISLWIRESRHCWGRRRRPWDRLGIGYLRMVGPSADTDQSIVDHAQWRRQSRRDAYSAFLAPAHEARNALKRAARTLINGADVEAAHRQLQAAHDSLGEVQAAWAALAVEGPESVEQVANGVKTALHSMHTTLLAWRDSPEHPHNVKFVERHAVEVTLVAERIGTFAATARAALDEATLPVGTRQRLN